MDKYISNIFGNYLKETERIMAEYKDKSKIDLGGIKSSHIKRRIFSFLYEKQKLKMIINRKELQNICLIDIEYYKKISGKYKIGENNGKGQEYIINTNILIFEGEYLKGKRNGKGKEYYENGKLKFEGEYLNGKRWNGKGYNIFGNMEFEIKDGKGNIKEYYYNDKLKFEGEYLNGERNGKGVEYYKNGVLKFEGEYLNGERNGKGKEYYKKGVLKFEGEYLNGKRWNGKIYTIFGDMEFEIKDGKGSIKEYYYNGKLKFEGEYLNGERNGKGKEYYKKGE